MSGRNSQNCSLEEDEGFIQQEQRAAETGALNRMSDRRKRVFYPRAVKRREEERLLRRHSQGEGEVYEENIGRERRYWQKEAKIYKKTFPSFKKKIILAYGETFYYNGGSWHGEESRRYCRYHIRKSMDFLKSNMDTDED